MGNYDDLLSLPHPQSQTRPRMRPEDRAAQFAPFAVLTGMEEALHAAEQTLNDAPENADPAEDSQL